MISLSFINTNTNFNYTIPTPFNKYLFEYAKGFRTTFFLFPIAYFITYKSISAENFNLSIGSLFFVGLICMSYYQKTENDFFVWNSKLTTKSFLIKKIKTSILYFSILSLPIVLVILLFYRDQILLTLELFLLCCIYLATIILAKYAAFPKNIDIPQTVLVLLSFMLPPFLIAVIPWLYIESTKNLNPILDVKN